MSPTSYQTAPPRELMIATVLDGVKPADKLVVGQFADLIQINCGAFVRGRRIHRQRKILGTGKQRPCLPRQVCLLASALHLGPLAGVHDLRGVNRGVIKLLFENSAVLAN